MIVTIVRMSSATEIDDAAVIAADVTSNEQARRVFGANAVSYLAVPGLLWKAYLLSDDRRTVGGTYWWTDRASAEAMFNDGWRAGVTEKYGAPPTVEWFEAPVVVDARFDLIRTEAPPAKARGEIRGAAPRAAGDALADPAPQAENGP